MKTIDVNVIEGYLNQLKQQGPLQYDAESRIGQEYRNLDENIIKYFIKKCIGQKLISGMHR